MATASRAASGESTIETGRGAVRGVERNGVTAFLGVPFATASRFGPPTEHPGWTGTRDAVRPGPAAPQLPSRLESVMGTAPALTDETDCLTLNIWTPDPTTALPVLFWLHGGAWASGSGGWPWYDGERLAAQQGVVVVTVNYRLGPLGYLYLAGLSDRFGEGNFGFADQVAALQWVSAEIGSFGGDADLITVGGQSAGAHSAALLAGTEATNSIVRRLFLQSGPHGWPSQTPEEGTDVALGLLDVLGLDAKRPEDLLEVDSGDLLRAAGLLARDRHVFAGVIPPFRPTATDALPWSSSLDALRASARDDLEVLVGSTGEEMRAFFDADPTVVGASREQAVAELDRQFGDGERIYSTYAQDPQGGASTPGHVLSRSLGDAHFKRASVAVAEHQEARNGSGFVYEFDWRAGSFGACHCVDIPFLFGDRSAWQGAPMLTGLGPEYDSIAQAFGDSVGRFVRDGDPGWPAYQATKPTVMRMSADAATGAIESRPDFAACQDLFGSLTPGSIPS